MPIQIEVQDLHAKLLIDFYIQRLKTLKTEIIERERELKEINGTIQKLKRGNLSPVESSPKEMINDSHYSEKWTWVKKIQFAIELQGKPLTTKEIVDTLTEFEADFIFDRKRVVASISSMLSTKSGSDKEFIRVESDSGDFAYNINQQFSNRDNVV
jgi:hypothetical protein